MWKRIIFLSQTLISISFAFRIGNEDCDVRPEPQNFARITCAEKCSVTCIPDYKFPNGEITLDLNCYNNDKWIVNSYGNIPECRPSCSPACLNGGECIAPNKCQCPLNFTGHRCQTAIKRCDAEVPMPFNSMGKCITSAIQSCKITCVEGYKFPDGTLTADIRCRNGAWIMEPQFYDRCEPSCTSPCLNGGKCIGRNTCQCVGNYRGNQCQYNAVERCNPKKLGFNGTYKCTGTSNQMQCTLACPTGFFFEQPSSNNIFTCKYSDGFFAPSNVPKCDYRGYTVNIVD